VPKRPCLGVDGQPCNALTDRPDHRCPACASVREAQRGTTTQRGYGWTHQKARARLLPQSYGQLCPRCGEMITPDQVLDLGHSTPLRIDASARGDRIEHAGCNRGARD